MTPVRMILAAALLAVPLAAQAQTPPPALPRCDAPEYRQFDFWIGEWDAYNAKGQLAGHSLIEPVYGGCGVRENWKSKNISGGSLNMYDRNQDLWIQNWIDSTGGRIDFTGGWNGTSMVLTGADIDGDTHRMTFTPNDDGSVRQHGEGLIDGEWATEYDFTYRPAK